MSSAGTGLRFSRNPASTRLPKRYFHDLPTLSAPNDPGSVNDVCGRIALYSEPERVARLLDAQLALGVPATEADGWRPRLERRPAEPHPRRT